MKKMLAIVAVLAMGFTVPAQAEMLSDAQMANVYAGQFDVQIDDNVAAIGSAVADQKNVGSVGSVNGCLNGIAVDNTNMLDVSNVGDSAVGSQLNIAAAAGMGVDCINDSNSITNTNDATVSNVVDTTVAGSVEGSATGTVMEGSALASNTISALMSAVSCQGNIGAIVTDADITGTSVSNINTATVTQTLAPVI